MTGAIDMVDKGFYEANRETLGIRLGIGPHQVDEKRLMKMVARLRRGASEDNVSSDLFVLNS